jgi:hypothetical protein
MTATYIPDHDVDKLFVVMQKKSSVAAHVTRTFTRSEAVKKYQY